MTGLCVQAINKNHSSHANRNFLHFEKAKHKYGAHMHPESRARYRWLRVGVSPDCDAYRQFVASIVITCLLCD